MPDHVHLLITASEGTDAAAFMYRFKQASGFACNRLLGRQGPFWQASYYDHVVRKDEGVEMVRAYVLENPVRAGLVENAEDYPCSGSLIGGRED
jgi:REP element-mobilizing transposase RayT